MSGPGRTAGAPWWTRLILDEAFVMFGGQFREVALPLLMIALWPGSQSYALALLALYLPQVALARVCGHLADSREPKSVIVASYLIRMVGVGALLLAENLGVAVSAAVLMGIGTALNAPARTHYEAAGTARLNQVLVSRLRIVDGFGYAAIPVLAGAVMGALGRESGFLVSLVSYAAATVTALGLPPIRPVRVDPPDGAARVRERLTRPLHIQVMVAAVVAGLSWMANALYTGYILVTLHAGALGFGIALAVWGGAGLLSAAYLPRLDPSRPQRLMVVLLLMLGLSWAVMGFPVGFWVVAALGIPEGFATFLLIDLIQSRILTEAPVAARGAWQATSSAWRTGGRMAGLIVASAFPWLAIVHFTFTGLAVTAGLLAIVWAAGVRMGPRWASGIPKGVSPGL